MLEYIQCQLNLTKNWRHRCLVVVPSAFYCTLNTHYRIVSYRIVDGNNKQQQTQQQMIYNWTTRTSPSRKQHAVNFFSQWHSQRHWKHNHGTCKATCMTRGYENHYFRPIGLYRFIPQTIQDGYSYNGRRIGTRGTANFTILDVLLGIQPIWR